jgi:hypothetical protein
VCSRAAWHLHIPHSHYAAALTWGITLHFGFRAVLMEIQLTSPAQHLRSDLGYTSSIGVGLLLWIISDVCWPHIYRINAIVSSVFHVCLDKALDDMEIYTIIVKSPYLFAMCVLKTNLLLHCLCELCHVHCAVFHLPSSVQVSQLTVDSALRTSSEISTGHDKFLSIS